MSPYIKLGIATLLPVIAAAILYLLDKNTRFGSLKRWSKQIIFGIVFGLLAIVGTEWGIPMNGAQVNCRDAAVITAGLLFGGPAGIIAGVIGAAERWIAVAWGIGTFTRVACSVSTLLAGFYAAALRKYLFEDRKPGWIISFAIGVVMEVFHLTMVFITNMGTPDKAMTVVQSCSIPMITANGLSVFLAAMTVALISGEVGRARDENGVRISQTIQGWLLQTVLLAFIVTTFFVFKLQNEIASTQSESLLTLAANEVSMDIQDASDDNLLKIAHEIAALEDEISISEIAAKYDVAEITFFDKNGTVYKSSVSHNIGLNAADYPDAREFMCLLDDCDEFVQGFRNNDTPVIDGLEILRNYVGVKTDKGFLQLGFSEEELQACINTEIVGITRNRHVGETGYIFIVNSKLQIISAPRDMTYTNLKEDCSFIRSAEPGEIVKTTVNGVKALASYQEVDGGYYIISVYPEDEAMRMRNVALYVNMYLEILVFALLFGIIYMLIKRVVVNRIEDVNNSLAKITGGDLDEVVDVRSNREFASLSDDINATVATLKRYIGEAEARIDAELEFAKDIQASALPNIFPAFPKRKDFDIYASMNPAKEVGGDFYDFYMTENGELHVVVADVSGKGIPAAMFMMRAKTELKSLTEADLPLCDVFTNGNKALCEGNDAGMFVTAWQGGIDLRNGRLQYANAGHNPPLLKHADGSFEYLRTRPGFVLAGMDGVRYKTNEVQLSCGDVLYIYTDGVTEATNAAGELYGEERLLEAINSRNYDSMEQLCGFIKSQVDEFVGEAPQFDDITMLAFKYVGEAPVPTIHFDEACAENIPEVTQFMEAELDKLDFPMKSTIQLSVALDEIYSNIVRYAYPGRKGPVTVKFIAKDEPRAVYLRFEDEGIPYNPLTNKDPDVTLSAEEREVGGLGIFMVKKTMDGVKYKYENGKNILTIRKDY